jgi:hypothetical protein
VESDGYWWCPSFSIEMNRFFIIRLFVLKAHLLQKKKKKEKKRRKIIMGALLDRMVFSVIWQNCHF